MCTGLVCLCVRGLCVCGLCVCVEGVCVPGPFRLVLDGGSWGLPRVEAQILGLVYFRGGDIWPPGWVCLCLRGVRVCVYRACVFVCTGFVWFGVVCLCVWGLCPGAVPTRFLRGETAPELCRHVFYEVKRPGGRSDSYFTR